MSSFSLSRCEKVHSSSVWSVSWNPVRNLLATSSSDHTIKVWSITADGEFKLLHQISGSHDKIVRCVSWAFDGSTLAAASFDAKISIWNVSREDCKQISVLTGHENEVKGVCWDTTGEYLATCGRDKSVWIWKFEEDDEEFNCVALMNDHQQDVKKVLFHPHDSVLFSCSYDNNINVYDVDREDDEWYLTDSLCGHESTVWSLSFHPEGQIAVSCSSDLTLRFWDYRQMKRLGHLMGFFKAPSVPPNIKTIKSPHTRPIFDVSWSPCGKYVISVSADNSIGIFLTTVNDSDIAITLLQKIESAHEQDINCVMWMDSTKFVTGSDDGCIKIWEKSSVNVIESVQ